MVTDADVDLFVEGFVDIDGKLLDEVLTLETLVETGALTSSEAEEEARAALAAPWFEE